MALLLMLVTMGFSFTACSSDDDDEPDDAGYYDFSIVWDVVDKGGYTTSDAMSLVAGLTEDGEDIITHCTESDAKEIFEDFCQQFRYQLSTGYLEITLKAKLIRNEGSKKIAEKTFYVDPDGTTVKAPARNAGTSAVVVVE